jgi:hypothetical protein
VRGEEREDAAAKFFGGEAVSGGVEGARDDPELFGAAGGGVNHFRMATGKRDIFFVANQEHGKGARVDTFDRGNFGDGKAGEFFVAIEQRPGAGSEESFAEPGIFSQSGIIVGRLAQIREGRFGDDGFDARIDGRGLQHDSRAHGFSECKNMRRRGRRKRLHGEISRWFWEPEWLGHLHCDSRRRSRDEKGVDDGAGVVAFEPAVGGDGAAAGAVGAGVHHDNAVAGAQQEFGLTDESDAVVGDA